MSEVSELHCGDGVATTTHLSSCSHSFSFLCSPEFLSQFILVVRLCTPCLSSAAAAAEVVTVGLIPQSFYEVFVECL